MSEVVIKVRNNGPYKVTGPITLIDADGNEYDLPEGDDGRPVSLRRLDHEAVLRQDPFEDRLRGRRAGGAGGRPGVVSIAR